MNNSLKGYLGIEQKTKNNSNSNRWGRDGMEKDFYSSMFGFLIAATLRQRKEETIN
jgi:hypothetical protein